MELKNKIYGNVNIRKGSTIGYLKQVYEKEQEDDDDFALVVLSLKTGKTVGYTLFITTIIAMLAGGIYLIKKYVLNY